MKDIPQKTDNVDVLPANAFNSHATELETAVTRSGQTLDLTSETSADPDTTQLSRAMTLSSQIANQYRDVGSVNAYVLNQIGNFRQPLAYTDGMTVTFKVGTSNTGPSTINVTSLGSRSLVAGDGSALNEGDLLVNTFVTAQYSSVNNRFEVVQSEGRQIVGLQIKDENAISGNEITILNFIGAGISVSTNANFPNQRDVTVATPTLTIQDEAVNLTTAATTLNFAGAGVTATGTGSTKTITVPGGDVIPPGTVIDFAGQTVPTGWLLCDGATYLQTAHPNLFAAIGTTYGGATTTFRVPDCRGFVTRGWDNRSSGDGDPGRVFGSVQQDQIEAHTHSAPSHRHAIQPHIHNINGIAVRPSQPGGESWGFEGANASRIGNTQTESSGTPFTDFGGGGNTSSVGGNETRMKNIAFNKIIKT